MFKYSRVIVLENNKIYFLNFHLGLFDVSSDEESLEKRVYNYTFGNKKSVSIVKRTLTKKKIAWKESIPNAYEVSCW